jgi:hypothetical protein
MAVIVPFEFTATTPVSEDDQNFILFVALAGNIVAVKLACSPTVSAT